jgi:hypothetical protein
LADIDVLEKVACTFLTSPESFENQQSVSVAECLEDPLVIYCAVFQEYLSRKGHALAIVEDNPCRILWFNGVQIAARPSQYHIKIF